MKKFEELCKSYKSETTQLSEGRMTQGKAVGLIKKNADILLEMTRDFIDKDLLKFIDASGDRDVKKAQAAAKKAVDKAQLEVSGFVSDLMIM